MTTLSLADLAERLGLDKRPRSWRGDCPACSYPRAFSVRSGRNDRPLVYCANGCAAHTLNEAMGRIVGGAWRPPERSGDPDTEATRARKQAAALRLWRGSAPAAGTPADAYLQARGLPGLAGSPALRFRGDCPHPEHPRLPALVALVANLAGEPVAVHRTYLSQGGRTKAAVDPPKASLGPVWGAAIRLADLVRGAPLVVGEGIETAASAGRLIGAPAWAALSAGNLASGLVLPAEVRSVVIAADPDGPGRQAAADAWRRWTKEGRTVRIATPNGSGDFNDLLRNRFAAAGENAQDHPGFTIEHEPGETLEQAAAWQCARAETPAQSGPDPRRSETARAALSLLRMGVPSHALLKKLYDENNRRLDPLSPEVVDRTVLWAAEQRRERSRAPR